MWILIFLLLISPVWASDADDQYANLGAAIERQSNFIGYPWDEIVHAWGPPANVTTTYYPKDGVTYKVMYVRYDYQKPYDGNYYLMHHLFLNIVNDVVVTQSYTTDEN